MILIVTSLAPEANALAALCTQRNWPNQICHSLAQFRRAADKSRPRVVITRQHLHDGESADVFGHLGEATPARVIVLARADCPPREETHQLSLGAEILFRDPVRVEVLMEMVARYLARPAVASAGTSSPVPTYRFAGAQIFPHEHRLERAGVSVRATPKVIELVQLLHRNAGQVVPYTVLYDELFARRFAGDTANCRVLLAKADTVFKSLGVTLRDHLTVIPKSGYLYQPEPASETSSRT